LRGDPHLDEPSRGADAIRGRRRIAADQDCAGDVQEREGRGQARGEVQ
jgi:hypothetical protein